MIIRFVIFGEPASKANSRKPATVGPNDNRRTIWIKSEKARDYEADALKQIPPAMRFRLEGPVKVTMRIFYATERPDLDESLVLDVLQDRWKGTAEQRVLIQRGVYRNDRQVREKHVFWGKDPHNPRTEIEIEPLVLQQEALALPDVSRESSKNKEQEGVPF